MTNDLTNKLKEFKDKLTTAKAYKDLYERSLNENDKFIKELNDKIQKIEQTIIHTQNISLNLKDDIINKFENLISEGIKEVFEQDYLIKIDLKKHCARIAADIHVILPNGKEVDIYEGEGGGIKDFVSVLMRILYFLLEPEKKYPVFFLDENLKHLDSERALKALEFIKKLSEEFKIQFLFITHLNIEFESIGCNVIKIC